MSSVKSILSAKKEIQAKLEELDTFNVGDEDYVDTASELLALCEDFASEVQDYAYKKNEERLRKSGDEDY